jgi:hypothetical protein
MKAILIEDTGSSKVYRIESRSKKFYALVETTEEVSELLKFYKGKKKSLGNQIQFV